jgi:hypothetical protein
MWDTLQWIPSKTPRKTGIEEGLGLNRWGITVLDDESVEKISNILYLWRILFKMSSLNLHLLVVLCGQKMSWWNTSN